VNIGSGRPVVVREIAATLARILERPLRLEPADPVDGAHHPPPRVYADTTRLRSETTWAPKFSLEQGLRQTAEWWTARLGECA
jgi:nucleoside-diphosphate-sugar epimerase